MEDNKLYLVIIEDNVISAQEMIFSREHSSSAYEEKLPSWYSIVYEINPNVSGENAKLSMIHISFGYVPKKDTIELERDMEAFINKKDVEKVVEKVKQEFERAREYTRDVKILFDYIKDFVFINVKLYGRYKTI